MCTLKIPSGVKTGSNQSYTITAYEDVNGWRAVSALPGTVNPEVIHFK